MGRWALEVVGDGFLQAASWRPSVYSFHPWPDHSWCPFLPVISRRILPLIRYLPTIRSAPEVIKSLLICTLRPSLVELFDFQLMIDDLKILNILGHTLNLLPHLFNYSLVILISYILVLLLRSTCINLLWQTWILHFEPCDLILLFYLHGHVNEL